MINITMDSEIPNNGPRSPEIEHFDQRELLDGYFKSTDFTELVRSQDQLPGRRVDSLDPEILDELRAKNVDPQKYVDFLNLRDKLTRPGVDVSINTYVATNNVKQTIPNLILDRSTANKIADYRTQIMHIETILKDLQGLSEDQVKERIAAHDKIRRELHNAAAMSLTRNWYKSDILGIDKNVVGFLDEQKAVESNGEEKGNGLLKLGRELVSVIASTQLQKFR